MFQAPGLGAGGGADSRPGAWGPLTSCLWAVRLRWVFQPSSRPSKACVCTFSATRSWVRGRVPSFGHGNGRDPASSSSGRGCAGAWASVQDRPGVLVQGAPVLCVPSACSRAAPGSAGRASGTGVLRGRGLSAPVGELPSCLYQPWRSPAGPAVLGRPRPSPGACLHRPTSQGHQGCRTGVPPARM